MISTKKDTIYQICGHRDEQWEMISTKKDRSIATFIQELNQHIRRQENQMCAGMMDLKDMIKITELEEELKSTHDGYEEEIATLVEKNDDLKKKLRVFMGFPATREDEDCTCPENYIIIEETDSDPNDR